MKHKIIYITKKNPKKSSLNEIKDLKISYLREAIKISDPKKRIRSLYTKTKMSGTSYIDRFKELTMSRNKNEKS